MDINQINVISLAFLGDAVYDMYVRRHMIERGITKSKTLQNECIKYVSAINQERILRYLIQNKYLFQEEIDIVNRGRNYNRGIHPKNTDIVTYKKATGFEALIGYLYLKNENSRLMEIMNYIWEMEK